MSVLLRFFTYLRWPVITGIIIGLSIMVLFPDLIRPQQTNIVPHPPEKHLAGTTQDGWSGPVSYSSAVNRAAPSVVNIYTRKQIRRRRHPLFDDPFFRRFFNNSGRPLQQRMQSALGSGVIVSAEGYLLTNNHLIDGADEIIVALQDGREASAELMGVNKESDLAVLKIDLKNLSPIPLGSPKNVQIGDVVLAIGNPFGMGQTVTQGIISATRRRGLNISLFEDFIQTDAAINPGNSGGALIDTNGNLLGINTAALNQSTQSTGFGFAIPADKAMQTLQDIIEYGRVVRGWLGVEGQALTQKLARSFNLTSINGVLVTAISLNGPAHKAGLKPGDVITHINQQPVGNGLWGMQEIQESRPGDKVQIEFIREGKSLNLEATLASKPISS